MKFLLLFVMLTACAATPRDMSGKMFTFPQQTKTAHVRLTSNQELSAATVCHRSSTDIKRNHVLFSLATPSASNTFLVLWVEDQKKIEVHIKDIKAFYEGLDYKRNMWHSICTTWDSTSGLVQLWLDGQPSTRRYVSSGSPIRGSSIIILGQEQDTHGGGFEFSQSFVGSISDVHMWDHTLSPCEIHDYVEGLNFIPGNVLNWSALDFQIRDRVLIEDKLETCY